MSHFPPSLFFAAFVSLSLGCSDEAQYQNEEAADWEPCAELVVEPAVLDFGPLTGTCVDRELQLTNAGSCTAFINDLFITGGDDYRFTAPEGVVDSTGPPEIMAGASIMLRITRCGSPTDTAVIVIRSDSASNRELDVNITR